MCSISYEIEENGYKKGHEKGFKEGSIDTLVRLVNDGDLTIEKAAIKANMTVEEFLKEKDKISGSRS